MGLLNVVIMKKLLEIKTNTTPCVAEGAFYANMCGCTGNCGQSCSGGCETGCTGSCGRSCSGSCS